MEKIASIAGIGFLVFMAIFATFHNGLFPVGAIMWIIAYFGGRDIWRRYQESINDKSKESSMNNASVNNIQNQSAYTNYLLQVGNWSTLWLISPTTWVLFLLALASTIFIGASAIGNMSLAWFLIPSAIAACLMGAWIVYYSLTHDIKASMGDVDNTYTGTGSVSFMRAKID